LLGGPAVTARARTLPLGVDIGQRRVRVALMERSSTKPKLIAVATREYAGDPGPAIASAHAELQTNERRCILALTRPDAVLGTVEFPPMPCGERRHAARFEAARFVDYPISEAAISLVPAGDAQSWVVGAVRRSSLATRLRAAKAARLRPLAVDDASFALRRAHPDAGGIVDVGEQATRLTLYGSTIPFVARVAIGGAHFTAAIADALGVDADAAEERKRAIGFAGAGTAQQDELIAWLTDAVIEARHAGYGDPRDIVVCGNGGRISGFGEAVQRATGSNVRPACIPPEASDVLPADVLRAAAPDWSLSFGLALWEGAS
jgi:Tfp pilus assembly PilM family ATPase